MGKALVGQYVAITTISQMFYMYYICRSKETESLTLLQYFYFGYTEKVWTAPEILRDNVPPTCGTPKADVYSYGIICFEIMTREEPYNFDEFTPTGK